LSEIIQGTGVSLEIGFIAGVISILVAVLLGLTAGYLGGYLDTSLRSFTDTFLVIPSWPILAALSAVFAGKVGLTTLALILSIFTWPAAARSIRSLALSYRDRPFIELAKVTGLNSMEILFFEILPQIAPYIIINFNYMMMGAIFAEAGLRFIGLGPPGVPSLGLVASQTIGAGFFTLRPIVIVVEVTFFILIFMSLNLINVGIEEEANPRLKGVTGE
ncbi:ABC transporter permease, partial [Caldivirga sp.]|uniref:ABC transporter permease n=1 Tax=Caldivirga sp. TaxID=2080243 RepID=UPI003D0D9E46